MADDSPRSRGGILWIGLLSPVALTIAAWLWSWLAQKSFQGVRFDNATQQDKALLWILDMPVVLFGGASLVLATILTVNVLRRRDGCLVLPLWIYYLVAVFAIAFGCFLFIPFKLRGM